MIERIKKKASDKQAATRPKTSRKRWFVPAVSTAVGVILVAVILILQPFTPSSQDLSGKRSQIFQALSLSDIDLRAYKGYIDSPFEREWESLKKAVETSKDKLIPYLSLRLAWRE
jgi:hypothetical protein